MTRRPAFTLIELLVVISIIALLLAILLPALGAARNTARTMLCLSNERQIMIANIVYAEQNEERFPPMAVDFDGDGSAGGSGNSGEAMEGPWWVRLGVAGILSTGLEQDRTRPRTRSSAPAMSSPSQERTTRSTNGRRGTRAMA